MIILYILIIIYIILHVNSSVINNEAEFENLINKDGKEILINLESTIIFNNNVIINNNIETLRIYGKSIDLSILKFNDVSHFLNITKTVKEIELKNLSIIGNVFFENNERITIENVSYSGTINSNFNENNEYFKISNMQYQPTSYSLYNCLELGGNLEISSSKFYGNSSCLYRLLKFYGNNKYKFKLNDSYFNGEYVCPSLHIDSALNADIKDSIFENGFDKVEGDGGAAIRVKDSNNTFVYNCTFNNNLASPSGGTFYLINVDDFNANNINAYNTTSLATGGFACVINGKNKNNKVYFKNVRHINTDSRKDIKFGGLIMMLEKYSNVIIEDYYAENLFNPVASGCEFLITGDVKLTINNMNVNKANGNAPDGLFINVYDSTGVIINIKNLTLTDLYQSYGKPSSVLMWLNDSIKSYLENVKIINSGGIDSHIIYTGNNCDVSMKNIEIENFFSSTASQLFKISNASKNLAYLSLTNLKINNIQSEGPLFLTKKGLITVDNANITNIHLCNKDNTCKNNRYSEAYLYENNIGFVYENSFLKIKNSYFSNIYGDKGISSLESSQIELYNNTIENCNFKYGIIYINDESNTSGNYTIDNSTISNVKSKYGTIVFIDNMHEVSHTSIMVKNTKFENISASKYGGIIYSLSSYTKKHVHFINCEYKNISASIGNIAYVLDKNSEPDMPEIEEFKKYNGYIATNPTEIRLSDESIDYITIYSGQTIPSGIKCFIYDDYDNLISINYDISDIEFNELIFFSIETSDEYNTELHGQIQSYCWGDSCEFPTIKVIGNPGEYSLILKINTYGSFSKFEKNYISIPIKIKQCNSSYINQITDSSRIKSCYLPTCENGCNTGKCVNINLCDCSKTFFTGSYCNEYFKMDRIPVLDYLFRILTLILTVVTIFILIITISLKNNPTIKGGGVDFLILILIGILISIVHVFNLTKERTKERCYSIYLSYNIGFAIVFGSILVKSLRIYEIFHIARKQKIILTRNKMYGIIIVLVIVHLSIVFLWKLKDSLKITSVYTKDYKEYYKCIYPNSRIIGTVINYCVIATGCFLAYSIRNVEKKYKEYLAIPIYAYLSTNVLIEIVNSDDDISLIVQDLFSSLSTIINIILILHFLYTDKIYSIYIHHVIVAESTTSLNKKKLNSREQSKQSFKSYQNEDNRDSREQSFQYERSDSVDRSIQNERVNSLERLTLNNRINSLERFTVNNRVNSLNDRKYSSDRFTQNDRKNSSDRFTQNSHISNLV